MATRKAELTGGPLDGADGDVVCSPAAPDHLQMGPTGGFVYTLKGLNKRGALTYAYDKAATRKRLTDLGVPLHLRDLATVDPREAAGRLLSDATGGAAERGTVLNARVEQYADRFELYVSDTLVEQQPRAAFTTSDGETDVDGLRQWVESTAHALAQEATA